VGCSSEDETPQNNNNTTSAACEITDLESPPLYAGPVECNELACTNLASVASCPKNECMYQSEQTGAVKNFRMGRIRMWAPGSLVPLAPIAVNPNVNAKCANEGTESFSWLIQVDTANNTVKTGGARAAADSKTFSFLDESVNTADLEAICPGFKGPTDPVTLNAVTSPITTEGGAFTTPRIDLINVPIFDTSGLPIILPLRDAYLKGVKIEGSCIGKWDPQYWCGSDTLGWTTGGAIIAKITAEDADRVPVKTAGCQSLCAILVNDSTKTDGKVCKRGADGKVPEIGTHCAGGEGCKNAFLLSATFGAYGVEITGTTQPPPDAGNDTATEDTATDDTGTEDAADDAAAD
jgi:hypothetical protein